MKTIGIVVVAALAANAAGVPSRRRSRPPDGEPVRPPAPAIDRSVLCPAVFDCDVLAFDVSGFAQALAECAPVRTVGDALPRNPITGIAGCCARAASGHAAAAPPSVKTNSRRRMWIAMRPLAPEVVCMQ